MNDINNYISEKLIINKNLKFKSGPDESDFIYPIKKKSDVISISSINSTF